MALAALVTGTSTGIGEATALHLARNGYRVFASMRNTGAGEQMAKTAVSENLALTLLQQDVCDPESNRKAVSDVLAEAGKIDVLVNNAGIGGGLAFEETTTQALRDIMETNFFGAVDLTQQVLPHLRAQKSGCILNVSSVSGVMAFSPQMPYAASKWALEAVSEVLAMEMKAFNVRVALIEPGVILTPIFEKGGTDPSPDSPYLKFYQRMLRVFEAALKQPSMPIAVAETILNAIETDDPKLRYLVGPDAIALMNGRRSMSDEEWIAIGEMEESEFESFGKERLGMNF